MLKNLLLLLSFVCCLSLNAQLVADCSFGLVLTSAQADAGDNVTIDVTARQFNDIIALQYRHEWNPQKMSFVEVLYNPALSINATNFNFLPEPLAQGYLNFVFVESSLNGITVTDNTVLYSLVMEVNDPTAAGVAITNTNDFPAEIIRSDDTAVDNYYFLHASVGPVQAAPADTYPSMSSACVLAQACNNPDLGGIYVAPSGSDPFVIEWSNSGGYSDTGEEITGLNSGTYQLALTDANGLVVNGDFYVSSSDGPELTLAVDADECGGAPDGAVTTTVSNGSGNYSYTWSNSATSANLTDLLAGTYSVTVTDLDAGCSVTASATVESLSNIQGFFTITDPTCDNGSDGELTINIEPSSGTAPFSYLWSNGVTTATNSNLDAGWYSVEVTDANDCAHTFAYVLEGTALEFNGTVTNGTCEEDNGSIEIALSPTDYSFAWSNGAATGNILGLGAGDYTVTVTENATGCTATETYTLNNEDIVTAYNVDCSIVDGSLLSDLTVLVWSAADAPYTFDWSTGETTAGEQSSTITVTESGIYGVTITGFSGCTSTFDNMIVECAESGPELYLTPANANLVVAENICLSVRADRFTAMNGMQFSMNWDENLLDFTGIDNLTLNNLNTTDFNLNLVDDGVLSVSWLAPNLATGETLPDNSVLFDLCLQVSSEANANTTVDFGTFPTTIELVNADNIVLNTSTTGAVLVLNDGSNTGDLTFSVGDATVGMGEQFCVSLQAENFVNLVGHQLALTWDATALQYTGVEELNLPGLSETNSFGTLAEAQNDGVLRMLWVNTNVDGYSLANGATIAEICFTALGPEGTYPIGFSTTVLPAEAIDIDFNSVPVAAQAGTITVGPGVDASASLRIGSAGVEPGQSVCIPVEAVSFEEIAGMQFSINWDTDLLFFDELVIADNLPGLNASSFNVQPASGTLAASWIGTLADPATLQEGTVLFEMCFTAQSTEAVAGVIFSGQPVSIEFARETEVISFFPVNGAITISEENLVWPGDTNNDGVANNLDLLYIGLGFDSEGAIRDNASLNWQAQYTPAWEEATPLSQVNYRHLDTNGDGVINALDTMALQLNWGQETEGFHPTPDNNFLIGAPFFVQADTVQAGAAVALPIILGVSEEEVNGAYGVAFTIRYEREMIIPGSVEISADGWLGTEDDNLLLMYRDYPAQGEVQVAMVRTDAQEQSGSGMIGELVIIMEDVILRDLIDVEIPFSIQDVTLLSYGEETLPTEPRETTVLVEGLTNTTTPEWAVDISVQPNPTTGPLQVQTGDVDVEYLRLTDATGKLLWEQEHNNRTLDVASYPAGVYYLQIQTAEGSVYEKFVKQ